MIRTRLAGSTKLAFAALAIFLALAFAGCGDSGGLNERLSTRSIVDQNDLPAATITAADRAKFKPGSVELAFVDLWRSLQFQDLNAAATSYAPGLRSAVGGSLLLDALRSQQSLYRIQRPIVADTAAAGNGLTSLHYLVTSADGGDTTQTVVWNRAGGRWEIVYDSLLADALTGVAQAEAQARIDPSEPDPGPEAQAEGAAAARRQSEFYSGVLQAGSPSSPAP